MYKVEEYNLFVPSLEEVATVLHEGLSGAFSHVDVQVVDCPDLRKKPYMLSSEGLCGNPRIADVGGVEYLMPLAKKDKVYDFKDITKKIGMPNAFIIGAGAGPRPHIGINCEMMANLKLGEGESINTHIAKLDKDGACELVHLKDNTQFCLLGNIFISEGKPGKVLKVVAKNRKGSENFVTTMRLALAKKFEKPVGLGLNLRVEHTHCFSDHGVGGHYHEDTTADCVEYEGYFNVGQILYRIDQPTDVCDFGKD
ncbi:ester hydrolase C11orf54 homolog [Trichonephila inaurata madagascariensis]|uniref:Ester hydrolase C11orf54 homolog n=1 Tax=Trichonephila inaurata madagascariensis TaxID=2747483 RepID=A0A8X6Y5T3_9ARAC|nr:ester hydrolase C11orf54 homolog [Trichonephila inaurata madagascariensis]